MVPDSKKQEKIYENMYIKKRHEKIIIIQEMSKTNDSKKLLNLQFTIVANVINVNNKADQMFRKYLTKSGKNFVLRQFCPIIQLKQLKMQLFCNF